MLREPVSRLAEEAVAALAPASAAAAQARSLRHAAHRPWPVPDRPWLQGQTWRDLLFAHWPLPPEALRPAVPAELPIDTFGGSAWIGVTPFEVCGLRLRGTPPIPALSRFPEANVRTYTTLHGKPGIWFLSLDTPSRLAVAGARRAFRLPYHRAHAEIRRREGGVAYRTHRAAPAAGLDVRYRPEGPARPAEPGTLEHFLTERYCLYALDERHRVRRADIHHPPWPLQPAEAELDRNTMTAPYGIELPPEPPLLHFAARLDVVIWTLQAAVT